MKYLKWCQNALENSNDCMRIFGDIEKMQVVAENNLTLKINYRLEQKPPKSVFISIICGRKFAPTNTRDYGSSVANESMTVCITYDLNKQRLSPRTNRQPRIIPALRNLKKMIWWSQTQNPLNPWRRTIKL